MSSVLAAFNYRYSMEMFDISEYSIFVRGVIVATDCMACRER